MTTKLTAKRFRIRRPDPVEPLPPNRPEPAAEGALFTPLEDGFGNQSFLPPEPDQTEPEPPKAAEPPPAVAAPAPLTGVPGADLDAIRREGLTGRQLRLARRLAQKHNLPATSDFDAVRLLRQRNFVKLLKYS